MNDHELLRRIAYQESVQDQLSTELDELDRLLRGTGFPKGIASVKQVALEMIQDGTLDALDAE